MQQSTWARTPGGGRRSRGAQLLLPLVALAALLSWAPSARCFLPSPGAVEAQDSSSRRELLASGALGALAVAALPNAPAGAYNVPGIVESRGPFEVDPDEAILIADPNTQKVKDAKAKIIELKEEAAKALEVLNKDGQADMTYMIRDLGLSDLRVATNTLNNLFDESTAAGVERLQRLMIQAKYQFEDEIPFPETRKGIVMKRGELRLARLKEALEKYIARSDEILLFVKDVQI